MAESMFHLFFWVAFFFFFIIHSVVFKIAIYTLVWAFMAHAHFASLFTNNLAQNVRPSPSLGSY